MIKHEQEQEDLQLNMAPMIDMVFLLIIFFLTATTFSEREREQDVLLPTNRNPGSLSRNSDKNLIVNIKRDGSIWVNRQQRNSKELVTIVRDKRERVGPELKIQVRGDGGAPWRFITEALEAIEAAGVKKPYVDTKYVGGSD